MSGTNGNGNKPYAAAAGIGTVSESNDASTNVISPNVAPTSNQAQPNVGEELNVKKVEVKKGKGGTIIKIASFLLALIILSLVGLWFFLSDTSGKKQVKTTVTNHTSTTENSVESEEKLTADAISKARSQVAPTSAQPALDAKAGGAPAIIVQQAEPVVPVKVGTTTLNANTNSDAANTPVVHPTDGVAGTVNANANANTSTTSSTATRSVANNTAARSRTTGARQSKANAQKSLVYGEDENRARPVENSDDARAGHSRPVNGGFALGQSGGRGFDIPMMVARPAFGSLLPVRTLGAIYTLRSGALVRMELTRDSSGAGWKLPRRTVIVGTLRGAEYDRAYVSIVGYIDSSSGRLVPFGGALLGSDAGEGMKGERRQVTSRWSRIFGTIANDGFALAQTALGRRSGATIVLGDAGRPEINSLTGNSNRREFVAVKAGSMGYVSVTDLPREIEGIDALAQMSPDTLAQLLNSNANTGTGLSDEEIAQLLASGSPAQIRAAMPRMNENMRRIAEQVIGQSDR